MEKIVSYLLILFISFSLTAELSKPFPPGYSMGNLGTIFYEKSPAEFELLSPATLLSDTLYLGATLYYTNYYDEMDNYQNLSLYSLNIGAFTSVKRWGIKAGISEFNAFGIYKEQSGIFSTAVSLSKAFKIGADFSGTRFLLNESISKNEWFTIADIGFSTRINIFSLCVTTRVEHIITKYWRSTNNPTPPISLTLGIHTKYSKLGAQGVVLKIIRDYEKPVSFASGMEFELLNPLKIHCAIAENPFFIAFGITFCLNNGNASFALVDHPVLGWSRGFGIQYCQYLHQTPVLNR